MIAGRCRSSASSRRSSRSSSSSSRPRSTRRPRPPRGPGSTRASRTRTCSRTRRCSTSATSASTIPFAFAMGALALGPHGRALDRRHAALDARRVGVPRHRPAARRALGVRRGRLGRLLRVGPVENAALMPWLAATAFLHSVMIQEKKRDAEGLEHAARRRSRSASRSSARSSRAPASSTRSTRSRRARSAPWFLGFIASSSPSRSALVLWRLPLLRSRRGSSRSCRARRRSSTTTCCSSRSA